MGLHCEEAGKCIYLHANKVNKSQEVTEPYCPHKARRRGAGEKCHVAPVSVWSGSWKRARVARRELPRGFRKEKDTTHFLKEASDDALTVKQA